MKPIGSYCLCNTAAVVVYDIDYHEDRVLAGINNDIPEWCEITYTETRFEFKLGEMFIPFSETIRI